VTVVTATALAITRVVAAASPSPSPSGSGSESEVGQEVASLLDGTSTTTGTLIVVAAVVATYLLTRYGLLRLLSSVVRRSDTDWDDRFLERRAPHRMAVVPAAIVAWLGVGAVPGLPRLAEVTVQRVALSVVALAVTWALFGALDAVNDIYERHDYATSRPIKGYLQLVKLVLAIVTAVLVVAIAADRSPLLLLSGLGAATAILLLVFRDTILWLVASIPLATNDMLRVGDWITIDSLGVDGDVLDIALHTVTIRNFDMTYAFVPTHELIETPFRNWRGMREVEGRRIMRSLHVDVGSVRFLTDQDLTAFADWPLLTQHVAEQMDRLEVTDGDHDPRDAAVEAAPRMTNLGLFRAYVLQWLRSRDDLHVDNAFPMMVRLREPTPSGQPVEVYCFARETSWVAFEAIQSDVFDHLHAILPAFDLRAYQYQAPGAAEPAPTP
jgi:miniconductance mechanosensitive channel